MHDTQVKKANCGTSRVQLQKENDPKVKRNVECPMCACFYFCVFTEKDAYQAESSLTSNTGGGEEKKEGDLSFLFENFGFNNCISYT